VPETPDARLPGIGLWERVLPVIPPSNRRDLGVFTARQAQALAGSGEPEQAVAAARQVAPVAVQSGSARMRAELGVLRKRMEQWRGLPPWRDLEEVLAVVPRLRKERER
jgi:hypothetical protein